MRQLGQRFLQTVPEGQIRHPHPGQHREHCGAFLPEESYQQMVRRDFGVVTAAGVSNSGAEGFLGLLSPAIRVKCHGSSPVYEVPETGGRPG